MTKINNIILKIIIAPLLILPFLLISIQVEANNNTYKVTNNKHIINLTQTNINPNNLTVKPGDTICIMAGIRKVLRIENFHGDSLNYIVFINLNGDVVVENNDDNNLNYGISIQNCSYFRFTGTGNPKSKFGIKILKTQLSASGLSIDKLSTNFEIDHFEIAHTGFAGIFSISQPTCDETSNRGNFVQRNVSFHDNYIHNTGGEGMYIGSSFYTGYQSKDCNGVSKVLYPHDINGIRVYNNRVDSSGWDGIQVGCATFDCEIHDNIVTNYGVKNENVQKAGIQIGSGTTGRCYNNAILNGTGTGINVFGIGNNLIYNNIIANAGRMTDTIKTAYGIFCDDRYTIPDASFDFINNTIINPLTDGIRIYSKKSKNNKFYNNLILKPGSTSNYKDVSQSYIYHLDAVNTDISNNYFSQNLSPFLDFNRLSNIFQFTSILPIYRNGKNVSDLGISTDFNSIERPTNYDIGAYQFSSDEKYYIKSLLPKVYIYPNPNKGVFVIVNNALAPVKKITIYTANAVKIYEQSFALNANLTINLQNKIPKGLYIISTETLDEKYYNYCILK